MTEKKYKIFIVFFIFLLTISCNSDNKKNSLILWHGWGGAELNSLRYVIKEFKVANPDIEVMSLPIPFGQLKNKYSISTAANAGPDLVIGNIDWIGKFVESEVITHVDDLITDELKNRFFDVSLESLKFNGHYYALPESVESVAIYYNKSLMPTPPKTIDEIIKYSEEIHKKNEKNFGMVFNTNLYFAVGFLFGFNGHLFDDKGVIDIVNEGNIKWLEFMAKLNKTKSIIAKSDYGKAGALFQEKKCGMIINGPWALTDYTKKLGKDLGVALMPDTKTGKKTTPFLGVKCFMFNPNSKPQSRKLAAKFVEFMTNDKMSQYMLENASHIPANKNINKAKDPNLQVFIDQSRITTPMPINPTMDALWEPMQKAVEEVLTIDKDPKQALNDAQTVSRQKLEKMKEVRK